MKYTTQAITVLWAVSNINSAEGRESIESLGTRTKSAGIEPFNKDSRFEKPDTGILNAELDIVSRIQKDHKTSRTLALDACPDTCTNEVLCNCMSTYYNTEGKESCQDVIIAGCKADEISSCSRYNHSDPEEAGYGKIESYLYCTFFQCLESSGLTAKYYQHNMTAYYACYCEARSYHFQKCEETKDTIPYSKNFVSTYADLAVDFIPCCATETSLEGLIGCKNLVRKFMIENVEESVQETVEESDTSVTIVIEEDSSKNNEKPNETSTDESVTTSVDSVIEEDSSDLPAAPGSKNSVIVSVSVVAVASTISGAFAILGFE